MRTRLRAALTASALLLTTALGGAQPAPPASYGGGRVQGWTEQERQWFWHATQGTRLLPMAWFLALEQPRRDAAEAPPFSEPDHLATFGFLPSSRSDWNPRGLPIGFAEDPPVPGGEGAERLPAVGLTCAACHTGQVERNGRTLRVEGGPAMLDLDEFQEKLGLAMGATAQFDERFQRFAGRILKATGQEGAPDERGHLRQALGEWLKVAAEEKKRAEKHGLYPVAEGPGRLDALGRGGNAVFGLALGEPRNYAVADAPVSYPPLWDTPWFRWAQYSGSISQPMARNVAQALGVRAAVRLSMDEGTRFKSSVRFDHLHEMEELLAGKEPGKGGLLSPAWPAELFASPIDDAKRDRGRVLYAQHCSGCHTGWPGESNLKRPEVRLTMAEVRHIGTDPKAAMNFAARTVHLPWEPNGPVSAAEALRKVTNGVMNRWYGENNVGPERRWEMSGRSENEWQAPPAYRARPLNGVWATAPYLHNGSVPTLWELLEPAERRRAVFFVGGREFDTERVGFDVSKAPGRFPFDTSLPGNSNSGHEFRDGPRGNGVIGPALSDEQRRDLIEYLKTL